MTDPSPARGPIVRSLILAALFLGVSFAIKRLSPEYLSPDLSQRWLGVMMGAWVVFFANSAPKALSPLVRMRCDPAAEQATRRFSAWCLVLGGAAYAVAWMVAPLQYAGEIATGLLGAAMLLVICRLAWRMVRKVRTS